VTIPYRLGFTDPTVMSGTFDFVDFLIDCFFIIDLGKSNKDPFFTQCDT
jgi:hypothetical protein